MKLAPASTSQPTVFNPRLYGALGEGKTLDTCAMQAAIDACARLGGGTVFIPAGQYLVGTLFLRDRVTLHLDAGATLLGSQDPADYPVTSNRWEGREQLTYAPLIAGNGLENVTITGRGIINGQGNSWWQAFHDKTLTYPRPRLIGFADCRNILIEGVTFTNSPSWTVNQVRCENVNIRGLTILNPPDSPNTDGINPDSCHHVRISDCYVSVGDDCISIKAGTEYELPERRATCCEIVIANCVLERGHGGIVIGSEMSGGVRNVVISNCVFVGTDRGIRLKSRRGRGGVVENISVTNIIMDGVLCPFTMNLYYNCGGAQGDKTVADKNPLPVDSDTPVFRHIQISHVTAVDVKIAAGFLYGLAEMPLEDISFSDISVSLSSGAAPDYPEMADDIQRMSQAGFFIRNAIRIRFERVEVTGQVGAVFDIDDSVSAMINP